MSNDDRHEGLEPAAEALPPEVATPGVAAARSDTPDEAPGSELSPTEWPEARPHPDVALPPAARTTRLTIGLLGAPLVWAAQLQAGYSLGTMLCTDRMRISMHLVSLVSLVLCALCAWIAWRAWQAVGAEWPPDAGDPPGRARFMAAVGLITSVGFFVVVLAQAVPSFVFPICY